MELLYAKKEIGMNSTRWAVVFRALSNTNRLKIIEMLNGGLEMSVGEISHNLRISITATSNHLVMLRSLDVLKAEGKIGHVYYSLNSKLPKDFQHAIDGALKS